VLLVAADGAEARVRAAAAALGEPADWRVDDDGVCLLPAGRARVTADRARRAGATGT
jgi:hypothetical protein